MLDRRRVVLFVLPLIAFDERAIILYSILRALAIYDVRLSPIALLLGLAYYYTYGEGEPTVLYRLALALAIIAIVSVAISLYYRPVVIIPIFLYIPADKRKAIPLALLILLLISSFIAFLIAPEKALAFVVPGLALSVIHALGSRF